MSLVKKVPFELKLFSSIIRHKKISYCIQAFLILLNIWGFAFSARGKYMVHYQKEQFKNDVLASINFLSDLLLVFAIICVIANLTRTTFLIELFIVISEKGPFIRKRSKLFWIAVQILRTLNSMPVLVNAFFFGINFGWNMQQYFIAKDLWSLAFNEMIFRAAAITNDLKENFAAINDYLEEVNENYSNLITSVVCDLKEPYWKRNRLPNSSLRLENLKTVGDRYTILCNILDRFNRFSKVMTLTAITCIVVNILYNFTIILTIVLYPKILNVAESKKLILISQSVLAFASVGQAALLGFIGESLEEEGQRTSRICYNLLKKLKRNNLKTESDKPRVAEIAHLLNLSNSGQIILRVGGFFKLNWSILGSIVSTVTTYLIVALQFILKQQVERGNP